MFRRSSEQHIRHRVHIERILDETAPTSRRRVRSLIVRDPFPAPPSPGQFAMVWYPGVDEIPLAFSLIEGGSVGVTVYALGDCSTAMQGLRPGDTLGIRGPLGRGFTLPEADERILMVGGGTGVASLAPLADAIREKNEIVFALGARTADQVIFQERLERSCELRLATDDGSLGFSGYVSELAEEVMRNERFDRLYVCGPEVMMHRLLQAAVDLGVPSEASLERYIKCGLGICDACAIGGLHVCCDGPVFRGDVLLTLPGFGRFRRTKTGAREPIG